MNILLFCDMKLSQTLFLRQSLLSQVFKMVNKEITSKEASEVENEQKIEMLKVHSEEKETKAKHDNVETKLVEFKIKYYEKWRNKAVYRKSGLRKIFIMQLIG